MRVPFLDMPTRKDDRSVRPDNATQPACAVHVPGTPTLIPVASGTRRLAAIVPPSAEINGSRFRIV
jgi:hypothetical protein